MKHSQAVAGTLSALLQRDLQWLPKHITMTAKGAQDPHAAVENPRPYELAGAALAQECFCSSRQAGQCGESP